MNPPWKSYFDFSTCTGGMSSWSIDLLHSGDSRVRRQDRRRIVWGPLFLLVSRFASIDGTCLLFGSWLTSCAFGNGLWLYLHLLLLNHVWSSSR